MLYVVGSAEENEVLLYRYGRSHERYGVGVHQLTYAQCCPGPARLAQHPSEVSAIGQQDPFEPTSDSTQELG